MDRDTGAATTGLIAPAIAAVTILAATFVDPGFVWADDALSNLGELPAGESITLSFLAESPEFVLFNGGLILTGIVGLAFAWRLWTDAKNWLHRLGAVQFAGALIALALVGVYYIPREPHGAVAIAHYLLGIVFLWTHGTGSVLAGRVRWGLVTIWLGIVHLVAWLVWAALLTGPIPGLAIPETVGAAIFGGWTAVAARARLGWPPLPGALDR
ncbi:DUF998 domain-containing protein [Natranaeroarchaeum sulfidigenes]|uniref:Putative membrane protein, a putative transporter component n=1 Tax=Natranaeroarchaeum sulfidigenes TaxID=2784880 RepID=A0A897MID2_9EURY|nr:DUF998 domain-containing protein [Natranaeroarchaeum sulfidigenes]QSG01890.1 putative membrane protein, a putative transporter component [Natranaeroarchaeum sulfidigenes]